MKPRRVMIQLEVETDARIQDLRELLADDESYAPWWATKTFTVHQVTVNVIKGVNVIKSAKGGSKR